MVVWFLFFCSFTPFTPPCLWEETCYNLYATHIFIAANGESPLLDDLELMVQFFKKNHTHLCVFAVILLQCCCRVCRTLSRLSLIYSGFSVCFYNQFSSYQQFLGLPCLNDFCGLNPSCIHSKKKQTTIICQIERIKQKLISQMLNMK